MRAEAAVGGCGGEGVELRSPQALPPLRRPTPEDSASLSAIRSSHYLQSGSFILVDKTLQSIKNDKLSQDIGFGIAMGTGSSFLTIQTIPHLCIETLFQGGFPLLWIKAYKTNA